MLCSWSRLLILKIDFGPKTKQLQWNKSISRKIFLSNFRNIGNCSLQCGLPLMKRHHFFEVLKKKLYFHSSLSFVLIRLYILYPSLSTCSFGHRERIKRLTLSTPVCCCCCNGTRTVVNRPKKLFSYVWLTFVWGRNLGTSKKHGVALTQFPSGFEPTNFQSRFKCWATNFNCFVTCF